MNHRASAIQVHLLGHPPFDEEKNTLSVLAIFGECRALEPVPLAAESLAHIVGKINQLRGYIEGGYPPDYHEEELEELGAVLFEMAFPRDVRRLFDVARGRASGYLPIELYTENAQVGSWPWEFLYDRTQGHFLCKEFQPICRGAFLTEVGRSKELHRERLRMLVAVADTPVGSELTKKEEIARISSVLTNYLSDAQVRIDVLDATTPEVLQQRFHLQSYEILHFIGHAGYDAARDQGYVSFASSSRPRQRLSAEEFARVVAGGDIRLVFLNSCEAARSSPVRAMTRSSVAAALLNRRVLAVIAPQFSMPDNNAPYFASQVYSALGHGKTVVEAVRDGRNAMMFDGDRRFFDWAIPALFTVDPHLVMFPRIDGDRSAGWGQTRSGFEVLRSPPTRATGDGARSDGEPQRSKRGRDFPGYDSGPETGAAIQSAAPAARMRIALVDLDAQAGFLPALVEEANARQTFFWFSLSYLPMPSGSIRSLDGAQQLFLPWVEGQLRDLPGQLAADHVCCLTRHMIAGQDGEVLFSGHFSCPLPDNPQVSLISAAGLRGYAAQAGTSFSKAMLWVCLAQILAVDDRFNCEFHEETTGCLFDFCEPRDDLMEGLRRMRFDHVPCRQRIADPAALHALDQLFTLPEDL